MRRRGKLSGPPTDQGNWGWHTIILKLSPAWRSRSSRLIQLIEFLEVENLRHAGLENGRLLAPYAQLEDWGMRRETLKDTIKEGIERRLIVVTGGGIDLDTGKRLPHLYRLTYYPTIDLPPTDDWKRYRSAVPAQKDPEKVERAKRAAAARWSAPVPKSGSRKKQKPGTEIGIKSVPKPAPGESEKASISAKSLVPKSVPTPGTETGTTLYISGDTPSRIPNRRGRDATPT